MSFWTNVEAWFQKVSGETMNALTDLAQSIETNGGPLLIAAAEQEVAAAETSVKVADGNLSFSQTKFNAAQKGVTAQLTAQGIPVVLNAVNGEIEAAVAKMNAAK